MKKTSAFLLLVFCVVFVRSMAAEQPMNILLITADDHGVQAGCYGDEQARTPNLDRLAAQGVLFQNAYVTQSSCSSSRSSILTGKYPHETGQIGLAHLGYCMKPGQDSLPALLAGGGYKTGIIGKHHVAPFTNVPFQWSRTSDYRAKDDGQGDTSVSVYERGRFVEDIAGFAGEFFEQNKESGTPFFLYVNYSDPHKPWKTDVKGYPVEKQHPEDMKLFDYLEPGEATLEEMAGYYNSVARMDAGLGMVLEQLDSQGLRENTLVIYLGDNGEPFPHAKATINQPGLHVPLIVDWPKKSRAGIAVQPPVSVASVFSTVLDAAGIRYESSGPGSLGSYLNGKREPVGPVFSEMNSHGVPQFKPQRCVFVDGYKLVLDLPDDPDTDDAATLSRITVGGEELYYKAVRLFRVETDPLEKNDLAGNPELKSQKEKMIKEIGRWMMETKDPWLSLDFCRAVAHAHRAGGLDTKQAAHGVHLKWRGANEIQETIPSLFAE